MSQPPAAPSPEPGRVPGRLPARAPGWTTTADVVVVGSGIAGLTTALRAQQHGSVLVVTKDRLDAGSTRWAQGGIAAALGPGDTPELHLRDTLVAGAGLCDEEAVRALVTEGPDAVRDLIELGAAFDLAESGSLALTREGGHLRDRIAHAGGDATGAEIQRALAAAVARAPRITVIEHALALDLILAPDGGVAGLTLHVMGEGERDGVGAVLARAVVLASGGLGQIYSATTNPRVATGDGMAMALRAGATLRDLEFVQFHPTVMWLGEGATGQQPLISEAVRGEGAVLVDDDGARVTEGVHELGDLAPRDVVAKAIMRRMRATGRPHVWLDARDFGEVRWRQRFPTILETCRRHGVDPVTALIPVAPACHYASGGVATDLHGRTGVPGLYACGEVACSGVHGANRLASNSLLEGLVFSRRIAAALPGDLGTRPAPAVPLSGPRAGDVPDGGQSAGPLVPAGALGRLQRTMTEYAGVLRTASGLAAARDELAALPTASDPSDSSDPSHLEATTADWETTNLATVAAALVEAALRREETRGSHWRDDHPDRDPRWEGHLDSRLAGGSVQTRFHPGPARRPGPDALTTGAPA
ncbi:MAG TPA: L-aspartate oxidase [Nocardioidaceae bacterium]|nr:L-aspartate oxidase [Nocardioidaceae bacterium]